MRGSATVRFLTFLVACRAAVALSQGAVISGVVRDDDRRPLPGVSVSARSGAAETTAHTDAAGAYRMAVAEGTYQIAFRLPNFASAVRKDVRVGAGAAVAVDAQLHLTASAEVVVTGKRTFRNLTDLDDPVNGLVGVASSATVGVVTAAQLDERESRRPADLLESVPGVVVSQHSGEGKANQYYVRGFNIDHGTDLATTIAGVPVNLPTHAHGQGYADANFLIPELVTGIQYKKGPYFADEGDFSAAGAINVNYASVLDRPILKLDGGQNGHGRALAAGSQPFGGGNVLYAFELFHDDGPWVHRDDYRRLNGVLRFSRGDRENGFTLTGMAYQGRWNATDQVPERAVAGGVVPRFGTIDPTDGGTTHRYTLSAEWQRTGAGSLTRAQVYALHYGLDLFSNFTYFLDDPVNGDQIEQEDRRFVAGLKASHQLFLELGSFSAETTFGIQARNDDIAAVGLYRTKARERLSTVRNDSVVQTSGAIYAQTAIQWTPWLRTITGLRGDLYRFKVDAGEQLNGGRVTSGLVSPKLSAVLGPFSGTEIYLDAGYGFHSNDGRGATLTVDPASGEPASRVSPLVRAKGAEIGVRTTAIPRVQSTLAVWGLDLDSELVFSGDAGITEPSRASRRLGVEWANLWSALPWLSLDADLAFSRARFRTPDPAGDRIPGAIEGVASVGASFLDASGFSGSVRLRYFGPRPLIEDDSVRSRAATLVNARVGYQISPSFRLTLDVFNLLNAKASDVEYFYRSRLPGEPLAGVDDVHTHPDDPITFRGGLAVTF